MGRAPCCEKVGLKRGRWTKEEDEILARYIKEHGEGAWRSLPKNAGLLRCGKSCRLRWINYLRADLKRGNISEEEEEMIIKLHATLGNRWSLIAGHLPGRTDNEIKNYWNSHLSRRAADIADGDGVVVDVDLSKLPGGGKRRGGRASRGIMAAARAGKEKKTKEKEKGKGRNKAAEAEQQQKPKEEEDMAVSTPSSHSQSHQPCATAKSEEQAPQASASGVTSDDGPEEDPVALSVEMMSALLGPRSPKLEVGQDRSCMDSSDSGGLSIDSESGPGGPTGDVAQELGDKAIMDWDLMGLDISTADDMWDPLVWDYADLMIPGGGHQQQPQEEVMSDFFFLDNM
ncbi:unnamed protein product [Urochloa decumbens]|uniref:Uncharacterized protein n=1 Tax=Urochloa decumbens TaxID=240449 RepID=A0ABC8ZNM4_9POAL